jgi:hypothetical protein
MEIDFNLIFNLTQIVFFFLHFEYYAAWNPLWVDEFACTSSFPWEIIMWLVYCCLWMRLKSVRCENGAECRRGKCVDGWMEWMQREFNSHGGAHLCLGTLRLCAVCYTFIAPTTNSIVNQFLSGRKLHTFYVESDRKVQSLKTLAII